MKYQSEKRVNQVRGTPTKATTLGIRLNSEKKAIYRVSVENIMVEYSTFQPMTHFSFSSRIAFMFSENGLSELLNWESTEYLPDLDSDLLYDYSRENVA